MIKIDFNINSRYAVDRDQLRSHAQQILQNHDVDDVQLDVWVVGSRKIQELNEKYLDHQGATDVLSFPQRDKDESDQDFLQPDSELTHLGEIVISFPEAVATAKRYGKLVDDQLCFYLEHGLMHLLGYHHQ